MHDRWRVKKKRSADLLKCLKTNSCKRGCRSCCGLRHRGVHDFVRRHVRKWDAVIAGYDESGEPCVGEWVSVKLPHEMVRDVTRKQGNLFRGKVTKPVDGDRVEVYVKQGRYPNVMRAPYVVPRSALRRVEMRVPNVTMLLLARRIGEGGFPGRTRYRINVYRKRLRRAHRAARSRAACAWQVDAR